MYAYLDHNCLLGRFTLTERHLSVCQGLMIVMSIQQHPQIQAMGEMKQFPRLQVFQ